MIQNKNIKLILQLLFVALYVIVCVSAENLVIDDAYITFQYSKNFAEFGKPWYNLDPTFQGNGQTSILWMVLLSVIHFFGLKIEVFFLWLNIGFGSFLIIKLIDFLKFNVDKWFTNVFNLFLISFFVVWLFMNSIHGLETIFACFILFLFLANWDKTHNYFTLFLALVRPEFILFQAFWVLDTKFFSADFFRRFSMAFLGVLLFGLYYFVFFDYYILLPFLYKSEFKVYSLQQLIVYCGLLLVFLPAFISLFAKKKIFLLIPLNFLFFYYTFNVQSYSSGIFSRYYFPLMAIYFVVPVASIRFRFFNNFAQISFKIVLIISVLRMIDLSNNFFQQRKNIAFENIGYYNSYKNLMSYLKPSDKVTINDAGFTAYFSNATCYDGVGLNDTTIMLSRKTKDSIAYRNYIKDKKINYISIGSLTQNEFTPRSEAENFIFESLNLRAKIPFKVFPMDKGFYLFVYHFKNGYNF